MQPSSPRQVKSGQSEADALMRKLDADIARVLDQEARAEGLDDHNADKRDIKQSSIANTDTESNPELNDSFLSAESTTSSSMLNYMGMDSPRSEFTSTGVDSQISFPLIGSSVESPTTDPAEHSTSRVQHSISEERMSSSLGHRLEREAVSPRRQVIDMLYGVGAQVSHSEDNILSDSSYHSVDSRPAVNSEEDSSLLIDRTDNGQNVRERQAMDNRHNDDRHNIDDNLLVTEGDMSQLLQEEQDDENEDYARLLARALNSDIFDDAREHPRMEDPLENLIADVSAIRNAPHIDRTARNIESSSYNLSAMEVVGNKVTLTDKTNQSIKPDDSELDRNQTNDDLNVQQSRRADEDVKEKQGCKPKDRKVVESDLNDLEDELIGLKFASVQLSALRVVYSLLCSPKYGEMLLVPNTDLTADRSKALPDGTVVRKDDDFKRVLQEFMKKMVAIATNPSPFKRVVSFEELDRVHWMLLKIVYNVRAESKTNLPQLRGRYGQKLSYCRKGCTSVLPNESCFLRVEIVMRDKWKE